MACVEAVSYPHGPAARQRVGKADHVHRYLYLGPVTQYLQADNHRPGTHRAAPQPLLIARSRATLQAAEDTAQLL